MKTIIGLVLLPVAAAVALAQCEATQLSGFGAGSDAELARWHSRVIANGGTFTSNSVSVASALLKQLRRRSYNSKIVYLLPLLGGNLNAALVPLRDKLNVGAATNSGFVNGDFSEATGIQGGGTKYIDTRIKPAQLGTSNNGGLGYWEANITSAFAGSGVEPMGTYNTAGDNRFVIDLRNTLRAFRWGSPGNSASQSSAAVNGHFYGQRVSATDRELYLNGTVIATNTTSDGTAGASDTTISILSVNAGAFSGGRTYWSGRCTVAYMTDGTLTAGEISDLHSLLQTYLVTPLGR